MGFYLRCAIAKVEDDGLADRIVQASTTLFPRFVRVRRFAAPFAGVIAAYDPAATHERLVDDFAAHGYADEDAASEDAAEAIDSRIGELSRAFPDVPFAFVDVDCFGGTCRFHGFVVRDGGSVHREDTSSTAHVRLFAQLGVADPQWHFPPFTRGFMESGVASDLSRLPITFSVQARWNERFRLTAIRASTLPAPWKVTIFSESACVVVHGEELYASLHPVEDQVELRCRSFVDLARTKVLALELVDDDIPLDLRDADGKPV